MRVVAWNDTAYLVDKSGDDGLVNELTQVHLVDLSTGTVNGPLTLGGALAQAEPGDWKLEAGPEADTALGLAAG